jgi:hypothetical protein
VFPVPDLKNYHKFLRTMAAIEAKAAEGFAWKRRLVWAEAKARKQLGLGW